MSIESAIGLGPGFFCGLSLTADELTHVRGLVSRSFLRRIAETYPDLTARFGSVELDRYHELAGLIDHKRLWAIEHRILDREALEEVRSTSLVRSLEAAFGPFDIADAEGVGRPNMVWRVVRPEHWTDVGPMHADIWFRELGHGWLPPSIRHVRAWIGVYCERGRSGFRVVPDSHKRNWPYRGEKRDGFAKPTIDIDEGDLAVEDLDLTPGQAVVFSDRLLHRGVPSNTRTRVSLEFTLLLKQA